MIKQPDRVDVHVGLRVRNRRRHIGMSQTVLGERCGVTFQQIQKNERGTNRIGSSRMFRICLALGVDPNYFYEGLLDQDETKMERVTKLINEAAMIMNDG